MPASNSSGDLAVFAVRRDTQCAECGIALAHGNFLRVKSDRALCLDCADLGHLEYLPRGDTALTRRASRYSVRKAVVLEWSRTRQRYERQGLLVEPEAVRLAEQECLADADRRIRGQERAARRREAEDRDYIMAFAAAIRSAYPGCPPDEAEQISAHACQKHSGRVGRMAAAKALHPEAVRLAVVAHIRHAHTNYDRLLGQLADRTVARAAVKERVEAMLHPWEHPAHAAKRRTAAVSRSGSDREHRVEAEAH